MPINFVTGLPRAGKTLWTLTQIKARAEKENRQVYYCNIPGVTIKGWQELDHPDKWLELPDGALIVVDELQDFWGKQPTGSKVPVPILELSKHGKRGFDFYFITQEPNLVHSTPRDLCAHHYYVVRAFGANAAAVYKFERMQAHPEKVKSKGEKFPWVYNKEAFNWYKSADVHNIKRQIPKKLIAIPFVLLLAVLCVWAAFKFFGGALDKAKNKGPTASGAVASGEPGAHQSGAVPFGARSGADGEGARPAVMTASEYVASYHPRIAGLMHTAPAYDELTRPRRVPVPAACVLMPSKGCKCYTQDATPYPVDDAMCKGFVEHGAFFAFNAEGERQRERSEPVVERPAARQQEATEGSPTFAFIGTLPQAALPAPEPAPTSPQRIASAKRQ